MTTVWKQMVQYRFYSYVRRFKAFVNEFSGCALLSCNSFLYVNITC